MWSAVLLLAGLCAAAPHLTKYGSVAFVAGHPEVRLWPWIDATDFLHFVHANSAHARRRHWP